MGGSRAICAATIVLLTACSPGPDTAVSPVSVEAGYRLSYNDVLVGHSLFVLQIDSDGGYRMDAFTTPAGELRQGDGHEVLETSQGAMHSDAVYPGRFEKSVVAGKDMQVDRLVFDWEKRLRHRTGTQGEHTGVLLPGTQDRLSYILAAWQLALAGEGSTQIQIVSPGKTDTTRLKVIGVEPVDVPFGKFETVAVRRMTHKPNVIRALWFDTGLGPLPLRVVHGWAGNTVDMKLESLSRQPNHPR